MELIKRSELPEKLALLGLTYGESGVEAALRATGIKPTRYKGSPGERGRISLFDPLVVWVIASAWESRKRRLKGLHQELEYFRRLYSRVKDVSDAKHVPGFRDDPEMGAQLLMLTSPLFGMEPRDIRRLARTNEETLEFSARGRQFLVNVLQAYNNVYGRTIAELEIDPKRAARQSVDDQVHTFALAWLAEARFFFETDAHIAPDGEND